MKKRPELTVTPSGRYYVTNAAGTGGKSYDRGRAGKRAAQAYYREQVRLWEEGEREEVGPAE